MTDVEVTPGRELDGPGDPWAAYLAAAQRLDAVRRTAASTVAEHGQAAQAARTELAEVRRRLDVQRSSLPPRGVPESELTPTQQELAAAAQAVAGGPAAVLAAVREARSTIDYADAALIATVPPGVVPAGGAVAPGATSAPWLRNLLVYGPFAVAVLLVQIVLYLVADTDSLPGYALLCGFTMPLVAFGLGWLTIGLVFPAAPGGRVDRTPLVGALVCLAPIAATCMGVGALALLR